MAKRRVEILATWFARFVPPDARLLDVGCGDGMVSAVLHSKRPDIYVQGVDTLCRPVSHIPVEIFDGSHIPSADHSFDGVVLSDVLHHTPDPTVLLREARRVAHRFVLIKDHNRNGLVAGARLRFMDWVGNARFGVALPYNYWTKDEWFVNWQRIGLRPEIVVEELGLYPDLVDWFFGAQLHFIAKLLPC